MRLFTLFWWGAATRSSRPIDQFVLLGPYLGGPSLLRSCSVIRCDELLQISSCIADCTALLPGVPVSTLDATGYENDSTAFCAQSKVIAPCILNSSICFATYDDLSEQWQTPRAQVRSKYQNDEDSGFLPRKLLYGLWARYSLLQDLDP